jgi:uncharacterized protein YbcI
MRQQSSEQADLENQIAERIQHLYHQTLGQQPDKVICSLSGQMLSVLMENAITKTELLLNSTGDPEMAQTVSISLDRILQPQVKQLIEEIVNKKVYEVVTSTQIETRRRNAVVTIEK